MTVTKIQPVQKGSPFDKFTLVAIKDGKESGNEFTINRVTFDRAYKHKTEKPDGTAEQPIFRVKKKQLKKIKPNK